MSRSQNDSRADSVHSWWGRGVTSRCGRRGSSVWSLGGGGVGGGMVVAGLWSSRCTLSVHSDFLGLILFSGDVRCNQWGELDLFTIFH